MTFKHFSGHRSLEQIKEKCKAIGADVDHSLYDKGDDSVVVTLKSSINNGRKVIVNIASGCFITRTNDGDFASERSNLDEEPWFDEILDLVFFSAEAN